MPNNSENNDDDSSTAETAHVIGIWVFRSVLLVGGLVCALCEKNFAAFICAIALIVSFESYD